jgi:hypothetical protein
MPAPFKLAALAATAAMLIGSATPAMARPGPWGGYGYGHGHGGRGWHGRRGGGVSFGDVLLGAVVVGGVAAVANNIANGARAQDRSDDGDYEDDRGDDGYNRGRIDEDRGGDGEYLGADDRGSAYRSSGDAQEDAAADRCANAALNQAGAGARVDGIRQVRRDGQGWRVEGDVTEARGYGQSFVCGVRADRVDFVQLSDRVAAR